MSPHRLSDTGYSKSAITRKAILRAAIVAFGKAGYRSVSTRQIATAAGVNQPAINYHFGGKEELYLACAKEILADYTDPMQQVALQAYDALASRKNPQDAATRLKELLSALADILILSEEISEAAGFVIREMREPDIAYRILFDNLWLPGIELASDLIAATKGRMDTDPSDRVDAIMMISGIAAFVPGFSVAQEVMRRNEAATEVKNLVLERLCAQIDSWQ